MYSTSCSKQTDYLFALGTGLLLLCFACAVCTGGSGITIQQALHSLIGQDEGNAGLIVRSVRLPRAVAAAVSGSALAVSGLLLQTALGNPLSSPSILGVNSGAGLLVLLSSVLFPFSVCGKAIAALLGALLATAAVLLIAQKAGASRSTLILAGVAVSAVFSALTNLLVFLFPEAVNDKTAFQLGSFAGVNSRQLLFAAVLIVCGIIGAYLLSGGLELFALGDETAQSLGLNVKRHRLLAVLCACVLAGAAVSLCGLVSFVGLIVPNMIRLVCKDVKVSVRLCCVWGAFFLLFCDYLSRILFYPFEIPVGILLSLLGAPFFIWLLMRRRRHAYA